MLRQRLRFQRHHSHPRKNSLDYGTAHDWFTPFRFMPDSYSCMLRIYPTNPIASPQQYKHTKTSAQASASSLLHDLQPNYDVGQSVEKLSHYPNAAKRLVSSTIYYIWRGACGGEGGPTQVQLISLFYTLSCFWTGLHTKPCKCHHSILSSPVLPVLTGLFSLHVCEYI